MSGHIPREKLARIVTDLSKGYRRPVELAKIYHVSEAVIEQLRDLYGPGQERLRASAAELRRPAPVTPAPTPSSPASPEEIAELVAEVSPKRRTGGHTDGLSKGERVTCRAWCVQHDVIVGVSGPINKEALAAWRDAGSPAAEAQPVPDAADAGDEGSVPVDVATAPEPTASPDAESTEEAPAFSDCSCAHSIVQHHEDAGSRFGWGRCGAPGCGCTEYRRHGASDSVPDAEGGTEEGCTIETPGEVEAPAPGASSARWADRLEPALVGPWLLRARELPELSVWVDGVNRALSSLDEAWSEMAAEAQAAIEAAEAELEAARKAAEAVLWTP